MHVCVSPISVEERQTLLEMAAAIAGIASAVIAGASLLGTSVEKISKSINTDRNVTINICNYSEKYILRNPRVFTSSGYGHDPPQPTIRKNTSEACSFTKNPNKLYGCTGVLTYDVAVDEDCPAICCIAIMFSVPHYYRQYQNWFALGIFNPNHPCDKALFNQMYNNSGPFVRDDCSGSEVRYEKHAIELKGTMSPRAKAISKIELWDY
ncbi:uncharacterized protein [Hoplias malabaricus]|uniref:uncharacterized protein isoform X1 n=2 Tax=Hoplias malabaricus TaxID=27720 RepID=UPI003462F692